MFKSKLHPLIYSASLLFFTVGLLAQLTSNTEAVFVATEEKEINLHTSPVFESGMNERIKNLEKLYEHISADYDHLLNIPVQHPSQDQYEEAIETGNQQRQHLKTDMEEFQIKYEKTLSFLKENRSDSLSFIEEGLQQAYDLHKKFKKIDIKKVDEHLQLLEDDFENWQTEQRKEIKEKEVEQEKEKEKEKEQKEKKKTSTSADVKKPKQTEETKKEEEYSSEKDVQKQDDQKSVETTPSDSAEDTEKQSENEEIKVSSTDTETENYKGDEKVEENV
ncbi:hypothetical protein [Halobacillus massiliensis]|uniref:hypothetical protein n=1 Tax=Halobacillus massiliensis TaxID=1926286 RepID=UPI0009E2046F|nr:hypothetical protein [Halobacillus massiliensis]